jgi:inhibitor of cysteine peptidase
MNVKQLWRVGVGLPLLAVLVLATGCASGGDVDADRGADRSAEVALSAEDSGARAELDAGDLLVVTLESNPTTGYAWEVSEVDKAVLAQVGEAEFQEAAQEGEQLVGAPGVQTFRFVAARGETTLALVYRRSWEKDVEPLQTFTVEVVVR